MADAVLGDIATALPILAPIVPLVAKTVLRRALGFSDTPWDLQTEIAVKAARAIQARSEKQSMSTQQEASTRDIPIKDDLWVSRITIPIPGESIREALFTVIDRLHSGPDPLNYSKPPLNTVTAEWTGHSQRKKTSACSLRPSEEQKFRDLMAGVASPTTILFFHGGKFVSCDPASHRSVCGTLSRLTSGRCLSVRYRLAPQNPFPSALLDALIAYFSLLYPPPGAFHEAVKPEHIVLSGDSAGGNLATALLITLLQMHQGGLRIMWHDQEVMAPLPAGIALISPWMDLTHCLPSCRTNAKYDILPDLFANPEEQKYPPCAIWPAFPPRGNMYSVDSALTHPLVSPLGAAASLLKGVDKVPMFVVCGEELMTDEDRHVCQSVMAAGGKVVLEEWEAMPHCFTIVFPHLRSARKSYKSLAAFVKQCVDDPNVIQTKGTRVKVRSLKEERMVMHDLSPFTDQDIQQRMNRRMIEMSRVK